VLRDYEKGYKEIERKIKEENNVMYRRSKLLGGYTVKLLYG